MRRNAVLRLRALGEQQEAGIHARIAQYQAVAVDADRVVHQRHHTLFRHVRQLEDIDARDDAHAVAYGVEDFEWRVAGTGAQACCRTVDTGRTHLHGRE